MKVGTVIRYVEFQEIDGSCWLDEWFDNDIIYLGYCKNDQVHLQLNTKTGETMTDYSNEEMFLEAAVIIAE